MTSVKSSRSNSQAPAPASQRSGSISSQSRSSNAASSRSSESKASYLSSSIVSVGSGIIEGLLRDEVRDADKPDGQPTRLGVGIRRDSFTSHNSVDVTSRRLLTRHRTEESYWRKSTPALKASLQALTPQEKLSSSYLHLRHTPKRSGKAGDDLIWDSVGSRTFFGRTLTQRNRIVDHHAVVAGKLNLLPGTKDRYHVASFRRCKDQAALGDKRLFDSIKDPQTFVESARKAVPKILRTEAAGFNGRGIDGTEAGIKSKPHCSREGKSDAATHKQKAKILSNGTPVCRLKDTETYELAEEEKTSEFKELEAQVWQTWHRPGKRSIGVPDESYNEDLKHNGAKITRCTQHTVIGHGMKAGAVLVGAVRDAHGADHSKQGIAAGSKATGTCPVES